MSQSLQETHGTLKLDYCRRVLKRDYNQALKYYKYAGDYKDAKERYSKVLNKVEAK